MKVAVCGGGVIGASVAYFLSRQGVAVTLIERCAVACAASGKAGGFLALDWCDGTPLEALARRSFALHEALQRTLAGDWGYRRLETWAAIAEKSPNPRQDQPMNGSGWLDGHAIATGRLGTASTTAQVHPAAFTHALIAAACANGATVVTGAITGIAAQAGRITGVRLGRERIAADRVVITLGPWSARALDGIALPPVHGLKGVSLVFDFAAPAQALFVDYRSPSGIRTTPEIFPRPDGTTYVCGLPSETPLPDDPATIAPAPGEVQTLREIVATISPSLAAARILTAQACYRPVTHDGLPCIGPLPGIAGAFIATGHGPWGILNAPATGEAVAALITGDGSASVDLAPFDPIRLTA